MFGVCQTVYGGLSKGTTGLHKERLKRGTEGRAEEELGGDGFTGKEARNPAKNSFFTIKTVTV